MSQSQSVTLTNVKLDEVGGLIEMNIAGMSELRGQLDLDNGAVGACRLAYEYSCSVIGGKFHEPTTATRISAEGVTATAIDCSAFSRVRLRVVIASATSGTMGTISLAARGN